jgi:metallophosphoesterase superfamily enzyme
MSSAYVHVSDIHFGQEKGGEVFIHEDAKERLIDDVAKVIETVPAKKAAGIIVTGDIAYGGKTAQYKEAAKWLDRLSAAVGCEITDIQVVPGNHDIDHDEISQSAEWMLSEIAAKGEKTLDSFLENDLDRGVLYARFSAYIPFAEGYNCSMDRMGGLASEKTLELAPGRTLRFIGLNSALICKRKDNVGELLLGARQRVLPTHRGQELVVLSHHPLHWLQDSEDARRFVQSRARIFISGHEHKPAVTVDQIEPGCDLMRLEAGATVPPTADGVFTYTYNVLEFSWDNDQDKLKVVVHPRAWDDDKKRFEDDPIRLGGKEPTYHLGCPNFRAAPEPDTKVTEVLTMPAQTKPDAISVNEVEKEKPLGVPPDYPLILLRFFRDLTDAQRIAILVKLDALPADWSESSSHAFERKVLDALVLAGRADAIRSAIKEQQKGE